MDLLMIVVVQVALMFCGLRLMIGLVPSRLVRGWLDAALRSIGRLAGRLLLFLLRQLHYWLLRVVGHFARRLRRRLFREE